jgi:tyrosine-protein phosphatase non-receptor type 9
VPCLDDTRIQLNNEINDDDDDDDYIHANYVDGYKQKNAYISTQGPLDETCEDFWKMIWQENILVLVMTTKCMEQRRKKCSQYWPAIENETFKFGDFEIKNEKIVI